MTAMGDIIKNKYFWIAVLLGLVIGDFIGVSLARPQQDVFDSANASTSPYMVIVTDQMAGDMVMVDEVKTDVSSWLAVRENNGELLGRILGARRVDSGTTKGVSVELLRATTANLMYAVVMYQDNGDGEFDNKTDILINYSDVPVMSRFIAR